MSAEVCRRLVLAALCLTVGPLSPLHAQTTPRPLTPSPGTSIKPGDTRPGDTRPGDTRPGDTRSGDTKPGDTKPGESKPPTTQVTVEVLTSKDTSGLTVQRWGQLFAELQVPFTIRRGLSSDKPEVTEALGRGNIRMVKVVGQLDSRGRLILGDRSFAEGDAAKIRQWIQDLRVYGAQGAPGGQPVWGLSKTQFGALFRVLGQPLAKDPQGRDVADALSLFQLPAEYPLSLSASAQRVLREKNGGRPIVRQSLQGISHGTALAILLHEQGLGFRPRRTPAGSIELIILPLAESTDVWPVGWTSPKQLIDLAPKLLAFQEIELENIELVDVLSAAGDVVGVPIFIDYHTLAAKQIDITQVKVSFPMRRTAWMTALRQLTFSAKAKPELYVDEANKPFLWITHVSVQRPAPFKEKQ